MGRRSGEGWPLKKLIGDIGVCWLGVGWVGDGGGDGGDDGGYIYIESER